MTCTFTTSDMGEIERSSPGFLQEEFRQVSATHAKEGRVQIEADFITYAGSNLFAALLKSVSGLSADSVWADLSEADFSGYAHQTLSFPTPTIDGGTGKSKSTAPGVTFAHSGGGTANTIVGYAVGLNVGGTNKLLFWDSFGSSRSMAVSGDSITLTPTMTETQG